MSYKSYGQLGNKPQKNVDHFSVPELANAQHKGQIISQNRIVVIDIHANWCGPCRKIAPDYSVLAAKYNKPGECILVKENLDKKLTHGITGVPTFHFIVQGHKVGEVVGANLTEVEAKLVQILQGGVAQSPAQNQGPQFNRNALRHHVRHGHNIPSDSPNAHPYQGGDSGALYHQPYNDQQPQQNYNQQPYNSQQQQNNYNQQTPSNVHYQ